MSVLSIRLSYNVIYCSNCYFQRVLLKHGDEVFIVYRNADSDLSMTISFSISVCLCSEHLLSQHKNFHSRNNANDSDLDNDVV